MRRMPGKGTWQLHNTSQKLWTKLSGVTLRLMGTWPMRPNANKSPPASCAALCLGTCLHGRKVKHGRRGDDARRQVVETWLRRGLVVAQDRF